MEVSNLKLFTQRKPRLNPSQQIQRSSSQTQTRDFHSLEPQIIFVSAAVEWVAFLISIMEITGFNLENDMDYSEGFLCLSLPPHSDSG